MPALVGHHLGVPAQGKAPAFRLQAERRAPQEDFRYLEHIACPSDSQLVLDFVKIEAGSAGEDLDAERGELGQVPQRCRG